MSATHTSGLWVEEVFDEEHTGWINNADGVEISRYGGCGSHLSEWPNRADLALTLAAPELLAACERIQAAIGDRLLAKGPLSLAYAHAVLSQIDSAVKKARGGK